MKGKFILIGKNGEKYFFRYFANAVKRYMKIYPNDLVFADLDRFLISEA